MQIRNKDKDILKIDPKTGEAFFTGGNFETILVTGKSIIGNDVRFMGNIYSGPLILTDDTPSGNKIIIKAGTRILDIHRYIKTGDKDYGPFIGKYGNINFSYYRLNTQTTIDKHHNIRFYLFIALYDERKNKIFEENEERETIPHDFIITHVIQTGAKTFILKDLPTSMPSEKGMVWNDNGTLRIVN